MKVFIVIEDDDGNLHQAHTDESEEIIISNLVKVYPNNSFTKDFINNVAITLAKNVDFKEVK